MAEGKGNGFMPSKSLSDLPSTPSPTVLSAQTAHSRQILTPPFSCTSALLSRSARHLPPAFLSRANSARGAQTACSFALFHSLSKERKSSRLFPTACALFAKKTGVYPSCSLPRGPFPRGQSGIRPGSSCLSAPSETEDCRLMTDNFSISSIPGTFLTAPAYLSTTVRSSTTPGTSLGRLR